MKTWSQITAVRAPESASPSQSPPSCASGAPNGWDPDPHGEAAELRTAVSCGFLTATGGGVVDGVGTIKLSERPGAADQPPGNSTMTFWAKLTVPIPPGFTRVPWGS